VSGSSAGKIREFPKLDGVARSIQISWRSDG